VTTAPDPWPAGEWRHHLAGAIRDIGELLELLEIEAEDLGVDATSTAARRFPLRVPRGFADRMGVGDPQDPLLRQVLPLACEDEDTPGFTDNPVGELGLIRGEGVLTKYRGRALIVVTGACAVHCRYCFRRHFPYDGARSLDAEFESAVAAVRADETIEEVILSGGDPLVLPDERLAALVDDLVAIDHVKRLRLHTRLPVVLPQRVDEEFVEWVGRCPLPLVTVLHANHPNELDENVQRACAVLRSAGAMLLNQAVLLSGVNDDAKTLARLSSRLADCGVVPYYLHLLDRVAGAAHFEVDECQALELVQKLRVRLPGYLVPRLVREVEGAPSKVVVG
jgi:EF-P beta-lysylation protein EpmB